MQKRFALRIHMTFILVATFLIGIIATRLLLDLHIFRMWLRYMLAVVAAYAGFLALIKGWLLYLGICARHDRNRSSADLLDLGDFGNVFCDFGSRSLDVAGDAFGGGGGKFGGGGASGSWGTPEPVISAPVNASSGGGGGLDLGFDFDEGWVFVLLIVVVLAVVSCGVYLVWAAPAIFGETAFHAALTAALIKKTKQMYEPGWVGSVVKSTAIPFAIVLASTIALGVVAQKHCPSAIRLRDALTCSRR